MLTTLATLALLTFAPQEEAGAGLPLDFEPALVRFLEENHVPGLALGIVDDGRVVYARGFGETSRGSGKPITTRSIFHMASVSKPFTATLHTGGDTGF